MKVGDKVRVHQVNERHFGSEGTIVMNGFGYNSSGPEPKTWMVFFDWKKPQTLEMYERELELSE